MSRFTTGMRVFFIEEPVYDSTGPRLEMTICPKTKVHVVTPHLDGEPDKTRILEHLLLDFIRTQRISHPLLWFYTPMALEFFPRSVVPAVVVYDCMDELSMFRGAPEQLQTLESELLGMADLVFTGGVSLFEAKCHRHSKMFPFPSGVDASHFIHARGLPGDFEEQRNIPRPRIGYAGVIDERLDLPLVDELTARKPDWQFIMIGPTAKISNDSLPRRANIHWLGMKPYSDLPKYFAGWDVAMMPFALNESTRFISPTKTPEFLAAGLPVVSTAIRDVVRPYGDLGLARIAHSPDEFIHGLEQSLTADMCLKWRERADEYLKGLSWDSIWNQMNRLIAETQTSKTENNDAGVLSAIPQMGLAQEKPVRV